MPTKCYLCLDTKYIYKRYLHNSHLESQPNIISTVLMHLLRISLFVKFKCSEPNQAVAYGQEVTLWPQAGSLLAPRCSAAVHIALFGTLLLGLSVHIAYWSSHCNVWDIAHCTVQHSLARPLLGQTVHLPDALKDVAFPAISGDWISLAKFVRMLARAVRLNYRRSFLLIFLSLAACLSTWSPEACRWVCGRARWGCVCSAATCTGTGRCCWAPPKRCRCCRRDDLTSGLCMRGMRRSKEENEDNGACGKN